MEPSALQKLLKRPLLSIKLKRDSKKTLSIRGLFGRPLVDVCPEDRLPESLMVRPYALSTSHNLILAIMKD